MTTICSPMLAALAAAVAHSPIVVPERLSPAEIDAEVLRWIASHVKAKKPLGLC